MVCAQQHKETFPDEEILLPTAVLPIYSKIHPTKEFCESSERSKQRKTMDLRNNVSVDDFIYATQMNQRLQVIKISRK